MLRLVIDFVYYCIHYSVYLSFLFFVIFTILFGIGFYFSTPEGNAFILRTLARLGGGKMVKDFHCSKLNFFPFFMENFSCTMAGNKKSPEATMSFKRLQVHVEYAILLNPYFYFSSSAFDKHSTGNLALIQVVFDGMYAASPSIQFKDFLGTSSLKADDSLYHKRLDPKKYTPVPTSSPLVLAIKKAMATAMKLVDIRFNGFDFDFLLPVNTCEIHGKCSQMILQFKDSKTLGLLGMKVWNTILDGEVTIIEDGTKAFEYRGERARFAVDYYLPKGMMDVMVMLHGQRDYAWVNLYPFVQFYIKYQKAEDDLLEAKMACGRPTASKMNMCAEIEFMKVEVIDHRMPKDLPLTVLLRKGHFELVSFPLTIDGKKTMKSRYLSEEINYDPTEGSFLPKPLPPTNPLLPFVDDSKMSPNIMKVMSGTVEKVSFHLSDFWNGNNEVEGIKGSQTRLVNNDSTFIDQDLMQATVDRIVFNRLDSALLDWMITLQDTSNRLPMSRFAHQKNMRMEANLPSLQFSTSPLSFNYDVLIFKQLMQNFTIPLTALPLDEGRLVSFLFQNFRVEMSRPYNSKDSEWQMKARVFQIGTKLPTSDLEEQYQISLLSSDGGVEEGQLEDDNDDDEADREGLVRQISRESVTSAPKPFSLLRQKGISPSVSSQIVNNHNNSFYISNDDEREGNAPVPSLRPAVLRRTSGENLAGSPHLPSAIDRRAIFQNKMSDIEYHNQTLPHSIYQSPQRFLEDEEVLDTTTALPHRDKQSSTQGLKRSPTTGSIWRFENFDAAFQLGLTSMALHHVRSKRFGVDFKNSFPLPSSTPSDESLDDDNPSHWMIYRDSFLIMNELNATWLNLSDILCSIGPTHANASTAGAIKFLCAFNMIKKTGDRITARMDAIKNRFVPAEVLRTQHASTNSPPPPPPPATNNNTSTTNSNSGSGKNIIKVSDLSMVIAVQTSATKGNQTESSSFRTSFPSAYPEGSRRPSVSPSPSTKAMLEEVAGNRCVIVKLQGIYGETSSGVMIGKFSSCEMCVNCFAQKPFLQIEDFSYEKRSVVEKKEVFDSLLRKAVTKDHVVSETQKIAMSEIIFHFHQFMDLGEVIDELTLQQAVFKVASTPPPSLTSSLSANETAHGLGGDDASAVSSDNSDTESEDGFDFLTVASTKSPSVVSDSLPTARDNITSNNSPLDPSSSTLPTTLPPTVKVMDVMFRRFKMKFDGPIDHAFEEELLVMSLEKFSIHLFQDKSDDEIQDEIALLDVPFDPLQQNSVLEVINPDSFVVYQGIFGGQLKMSMDSMLIHLSLQQEPFFEAYKLSWTGVCYNASVKDDRIPVQYRLVDIVDTMVLQPWQGDDLEDDQGRNLFGLTLPAVASPTDAMYAVVQKPLAPGKIYLDLVWSGETMDVSLHNHTPQCLEVANKIFEISTPPVLDPSPLLAPWDSLRFWLHGAFAFKFQKLTVIKNGQDYLHQNVKLKLSMVNPEWHMDAKSFEFTFNNLEAVAEMTTKILPGRGRASARRPKISHVTMKICEVPAMILAVRHHHRVSLKDGRRSRFYNHHDVYLHPALVVDPEIPPVNSNNTAPSIRQSIGSNPINSGNNSSASLRDDLTKYYVNNEFVDELRYIQNDRFYYFRSNKMSINYDVELRLADRNNEPITINLRLDNLVRILGSINDPQPAQHRSNSQSPVLGVEDMRLLILKPPPVARPPNTLTMGMMANEVKLQMIINRIIFCSWPSSKNFFGVASMQEFTDLQLHLIRKNIEKVFLTNVINNTTFATVSGLSESNDSAAHQGAAGPLKFWDYYPSNKRLIIFRNELLQGIEDKNFPIQIDHLFMEIYFGEIYVREWTTKHLAFSQLLAGSKKFLSGRSHLHTSFGGGGASSPGEGEFTPGKDSAGGQAGSPHDDDGADANFEPKTVDDVTELFKPIHRLAHTSKVIISLTESGEVSSRCNLFSLSGILRKRDESAANDGCAQPFQRSNCLPRRMPGSRSGGKVQMRSDFLIGKEWRKKSLEMHIGCASPNTSADFFNKQKEALCGVRRTTLERQSTSNLSDADQNNSRPRSASRNPKSRKSMLLSPGIMPSAASGFNGNPARTRTESSETAVSQVKDSLVKRRRDSIIKAETPYSGHGANRRRSSVSGKPQRKLKWGSVTMGFKANFRNFVDNHSAFTPPSCALPESYKSHQIRPSSHNRFFQKSAPYTDKFGYLNGQKAISDSDDQASSFGNKIWGLKVVDCRILFSIKIRDVLFSYVARCLDLFTSEDEETNSITKDPTVEPSSQRRPSTISLGAKGPKEKATLMDFLAVDEESAQPSPNKRKTRAVNTAEESPLGTPRQRGDSGDMGEVSSVSAHFNVRKTESTDTSLSHGGGMSPGIALSGKGEFNFHEVYPDNDDEVFVDDAAKRTIKSRVYHTGGRGLQRASKTRVSTKKDFNFSIGEDDENNGDDGRRLANVKRLSIETDQLGGIPSNSSSLTNTPYSTTTPKADSGKAAPKPNKKIPINQHFFIVEVIDPQINFLDADKHGSLIIVAGRSSLEGKKLNTAILPPAPPVSSNPVPTDGGESEKAKTTVDPKRRQEIRLKMDGVSAFTIPTLINYDENNEINGDGEEFEDEVFWKQLESTSDARPSYTGGNGSAFPAITPPAETNGSGHNSGNDMQDSPFLKTAIKDFQIRALYVFWTDVSPAEAKELYVQQSKDALTCTFRLELPELAVDIFSWQFYVILNVVRNVLLVPPPVTSSSRNKGKNGEAEEPESAVVELSRDADLLSRFDIRANIHNMLDLMKQRNCEEVRMLVEEYLSKAVENSAIARFVEIFIGRVYWKLRTNTNNLSSNDSEGSTPSSSSAQKNKKKKSNANPNDQELVEAALTGIYATLNFFEDR